MGKKKKHATQQYTQSKQKAAVPKKRARYPLVVLSLGAILIAGGIFYLNQDKNRQQAPIAPAGVQKKPVGLIEQSPTLSPALFTGRVKRAYAIAREIPEVLDGLYCYCRCKENFMHKNLLSCYVDNHAST